MVTGTFRWIFLFFAAFAVIDYIPTAKKLLTLTKRSAYIGARTKVYKAISSLFFQTVAGTAPGAIFLTPEAQVHYVVAANALLLAGGLLFWDLGRRRFEKLSAAGRRAS